MLNSEIFESNGREIHLLHRDDGKPVTNRQLSYYKSKLNSSTDRQVQANKKVEEQRARLKEMEKKDRAFTVPLRMREEFAYDLYNGVSFCMRKYKATKTQIISEAKRIAPQVDLSMIRR